MPSPANDAEAAAYIQRPSRCPYCGSSNIEGGGDGVEVNGHQGWQHVECLVCGGEWNDLWTLTGMERVFRPTEGVLERARQQVIAHQSRGRHSRQGEVKTNEAGEKDRGNGYGED
jgi:hypothetical protein